MSTRPANAARSDSAFVTSLLRSKDLSASAHLIANHALELVNASAVVLYTVEEGIWIARAVAGLVEVDHRIGPDETSTLASLTADPQVVLFSGTDLTRESYAHLQTRRTLLSLAYVPFIVDQRLIAALEVLSFDSYLSEHDLAALAALAEFAPPALEHALTAQSDKIEDLKAVARLTQLYDLEKTFHSTLEMDALLPLISSKFRDVLSAQAVHIWLVKTDTELLLMSTDGYDSTVAPNSLQRSGEGIAAEVGDSGQPLLIDDPEDSRLIKRNGDTTERIFSLIAAPMMLKDEEIGVVEAVNKMDGTPFSEEDLFLLTSICDTAARALHNANLLQAERKVEILETLVRVSHEITSTLDIDRVLQAVVNNPAAVIPYERAAIALEHRGRVQVKAISGITKSPSAPEFSALREMLEWSSSLNQEVYLRQHGDEINTDREETRLRALSYFEQSGMRGFYVFPLADDQGRIGTFACESSDPDFLSEAHLEMLRVVASQATVALRNASLYQEVPFIGVLEPLLRQKQRFRQLERHRRIAVLAATAAVIAMLVILPIPFRMDGNAAVTPLVSSQVQAQVEGIVRRVLVREGQRVNQGDPLAELEDWEYRGALAAAEARYQSALSSRNRALAANDGGEAGVQQAKADYWQSEVARSRERLARTRLVAVRGGMVATPRVEEFTGRHLDAGQTFAEIVDTGHASVDVAIDEHQVRFLRSGQTAAVKLDAFPAKTFRGDVTVVSPVSYTSGEDRVYYARLDVPNPQALMRPGMQGRAKIMVGWRPFGYVLFRRPALWLYSKLWSWFGW